MNETLSRLISEAEYIVIGAGAGLSTAAGFEYGGENFRQNFPYMYQKYGYRDMYTSGFHHFDSLEEKWAYWSKMIYLNRYKDGPKDLYIRLFNLFKDKNYFVITTNVDHQFILSGFDKERIFYTQGDYGLFQCGLPCKEVTFDNKEMILRMVSSIKDNKIPTSLIPRCPYCNRPLETNLRCDDRFVEDEGWHKAKARFDKFISSSKNKRVLYLELGVGYSTPAWIKYPFIRNTYLNPNATYVCIDKGFISIPEEIRRQSYLFNEDIACLF